MGKVNVSKRGRRGSKFFALRLLSRGKGKKKRACGDVLLSSRRGTFEGGALFVCFFDGGEEEKGEREKTSCSLCY